MTIDEWIQKHVAYAPPFTEKDVAELRRILARQLSPQSVG